MKRTVALTAFIALLFTAFSGCTTVYVNAPPGRDVKLMAENQAPSTVIVKRNWYLLWGMVPISDNGTADKIAQYNLDEVKVQAKYDALDFIIDIFLGWTTLHTRTVRIEGRRR